MTMPISHIRNRDSDRWSNQSTKWWTEMSSSKGTVFPGPALPPPTELLETTEHWKCIWKALLNGRDSICKD